MSLLDELKVRLSVETGKFNRDFDGAAKHVKAVAKEILDVTKSIERGANSAGRLAAKITLANMTALEKVAHFSAQVQALRDADLVKEETYQRELVRLKKKFMETDPKVKADAARAKVNGYIASVNQQYQDMKENKTNATTSGNSNQQLVNSGNAGSAGKKSNLDGMSTNIVTRNPDSIFRSVSMTIMKTTLT